MNQLVALLRGQSGPGLLLMVAAAFALLVANSPLRELYSQLISTEMAITVGGAGIVKPLLLWVNDGLMALFFLLVGIELKHEMLFGHLRNKRDIGLPTAAAIGGMGMPALIYLAFTYSDPVARQGWAIPAATDIAFALAIFAMLARNLPSELKTFLLAIAIIDDLGAILIIALFYTADLSTTALMLAAAATVVLFGMNRLGVRSATPYLLVGLICWVATLKSGVHATLAGVAIGLALPLKSQDPDQPSAGYRVEHSLMPWVNFFVLPLFAFANSGIDFASQAGQALITPMVIGIALGLALGKPIGIVLTVWIGEKVGLFRRPDALNWPRVLAIGCLCGVGFTMSLFIGGLAFEKAPTLNLGDERIGIILGSLLSAGLAAMLFQLRGVRSPNGAEAPAEPEAKSPHFI